MSISINMYKGYSREKMSALVYIKPMQQHLAFLGYPRHQQFSALRFPNRMVKIRLEVQLL
jgi:hypothetical protein